MSRQGLFKTGLLTVMALLAASLIITIWLFHYLTSPEMRSQTFSFTLTFICLLEVLSFGYFVIMFIPHFSKVLVWAVYPAIGVIIGTYVAVALVTVIGYNLLSVLINSPKSYYIVLSVELLVFLIALGSMIILSAYKKAEDAGIEEEDKKLADLRAMMEKTYQYFVDCKELLEVQTYRDLERNIVRLRERLQFCAPFGGSDTEIPEIEDEIRLHIASLAEFIAKISSAPRKELGKTTEKIKQLANTALGVMEKRERLLVK